MQHHFRPGSRLNVSLLDSLPSPERTGKRHVWLLAARIRRTLLLNVRSARPLHGYRRTSSRRGPIRPM